MSAIQCIALHCVGAADAYSLLVPNARLLCVLCVKSVVR